MALDILGSNSDGFDLVITDVYMPEMDGFKLTEAIIDDRRSLNMPIIISNED
ncbi:Two-component response regulator ARR1 [Acorus calamus]|uniref:Two-component response regulator ARR1 n=1 Tax=Acorus calamus TaxID=4465 RepID=A0AAV9DKV6_ACOCL|nr:Two-component response regulator ARR1 [Acorus calamus]